MSLIGIFAGLTLSNYLYQAFGDHLWDVALERSWFQGTALVTVFAIASLKSHFGG